MNFLELCIKIIKIIHAISILYPSSVRVDDVIEDAGRHCIQITSTIIWTPPDSCQVIISAADDKAVKLYNRDEGPY